MASSQEILLRIFAAISDLENRVNNDINFLMDIEDLIRLRNEYQIALRQERLVPINSSPTGYNCGWCHKRVMSLDHIKSCRAAAHKLETDAIESTKVKLQNLLEEL